MGISDSTLVPVRPTMRRRLRFSTYVMLSQMLLLALGLAWLVHMIIIAANGSIFFVENNPFILWGEISACIVITGFAVFILILQIQRLGERRTGDRRGSPADRRQ